MGAGAWVPSAARRDPTDSKPVHDGGAADHLTPRALDASE